LSDRCSTFYIITANIFMIIKKKCFINASNFLWIKCLWMDAKYENKGK
jgi:hypothetical protein